VSGYLKVVKVDKGDLVKKGQVLAVIESPETDQAYAAAFANARNKKSIAARIETLKKRNLISQQEADQATSDDDVASAQLRAEETLKGYEIIRAPFDGTVTARFADPGALVQNATNGQTGALPVVTVSEIKRLRVDVFLDQRDAPFIEKDAPVEITLSERPGLKIEGRVDRLSDQLDSRTKMMLTEIDIPNDQGVLVSGSFVQVSMNIKSPPYVEAPVESLVLKDEKSYITVVSPSNQLNYRPIEIATNDGKMVWIMSGIKEGESVALNVGTTIPEGAKVRPMEEPVKPPASPSPSVAPPPVQSSPAPDASPAPLAPALAPLHQKSSTNVGQDNKSL
jgi:RND family efflux transporter MFP subunit